MGEGETLRDEEIWAARRQEGAKTGGPKVEDAGEDEGGNRSPPAEARIGEWPRLGRLGEW